MSEAAKQERLRFFYSSRSGWPDHGRTRHLGLCGRRDKSGALVPVEAWEEIHPAFRCAACTWLHSGTPEWRHAK
jgi:hypothetical protein